MVCASPCMLAFCASKYDNFRLITWACLLCSKVCFMMATFRAFLLCSRQAFRAVRLHDLNILWFMMFMTYLDIYSLFLLIAAATTHLAILRLKHRTTFRTKHDRIIHELFLYLTYLLVIIRLIVFS